MPFPFSFRQKILTFAPLFEKTGLSSFKTAQTQWLRNAKTKTNYSQTYFIDQL